MIALFINCPGESLAVMVIRGVDVGTVPEQEWDTIAAHGFEAVWIMGLWERRFSRNCVLARKRT
jgi:hypothetical protein